MTFPLLHKVLWYSTAEVHKTLFKVSPETSFNNKVTMNYIYFLLNTKDLFPIFVVVVFNVNITFCVPGLHILIPILSQNVLESYHIPGSGLGIKDTHEFSLVRRNFSDN